MSPEAPETAITDSSDYCDDSADFYSKLNESPHFRRKSHQLPRSNVRFAVHKASLQAGSGVFRGMMHACGKSSNDNGTGSTLDLPESAEVLLQLLDFSELDESARSG